MPAASSGLLAHRHGHCHFPSAVPSIRPCAPMVATTCAPMCSKTTRLLAIGPDGRRGGRAGWRRRRSTRVEVVAPGGAPVRRRRRAGARDVRLRPDAVTGHRSVVCAPGHAAGDPDATCADESCVVGLGQVLAVMQGAAGEALAPLAKGCRVRMLNGAGRLPPDAPGAARDRRPCEGGAWLPWSTTGLP